VRPLGAVAAAALLAAALLAQAPETKPAPTAEEALESGIAWLLRAQRPDGSWNGPEPDLYRGMTALAAYTLIQCGRPPSHPAVRTAVASLRAWPIERTYDVGCALMLLHALGDARPKEMLKPLADRLVQTMSNGKRLRGARWGYPNDREGGDDAHTDLSNTQYAILGLRAARLAGLKVGSPLLWEAIARDTLDEQSPYGGFGYKKREAASASMTAAGITILVVCADALGPGVDPNLDKRIKAGIERGFRWLEGEWSVEHMIDLRLKERTNDRWLYYWLYGLERLAAFTNKDAIGRHGWYEEGAASLLGKVKKQGFWGSGDSDTCFALLFLGRGSRVSGESARRRRDAASAADSAVLVATDGENPGRAWIRGAGPGLLEKLAAGCSIQRLEWLVDGASVRSVPSPSVESLSAEASGLRYTLTANGPHRVVARLALAARNGDDAGVVESNPLVIQVDGVEEARHREAVRDQRRNLLLASRANVSASSSIDAARAAHLAFDGRYGTHWLWAKTDVDPVLQIALPGGPRAGFLKLASAGPFGDDGESHARPRDVEIVVNGGEPFAVRLEDGCLQTVDPAAGRTSPLDPRAGEERLPRQGGSEHGRLQRGRAPRRGPGGRRRPPRAVTPRGSRVAVRARRVHQVAPHVREAARGLDAAGLRRRRLEGGRGGLRNANERLGPGPHCVEDRRDLDPALLHVAEGRRRRSPDRDQSRRRRFRLDQRAPGGDLRQRLLRRHFLAAGLRGGARLGAAGSERDRRPLQQRARRRAVSRRGPRSDPAPEVGGRQWAPQAFSLIEKSSHARKSAAR
jgi:hypothetical protein